MYDDILCRAFGEDGFVETHYGGEVKLRSNRPYRGGQTTSICRDRAVQNIADFHANILKGDFTKPTVSESVRSNLATTWGRMAAYEKRRITWQEMMQRNESMDGRLQSLSA